MEGEERRRGRKDGGEGGGMEGEGRRRRGEGEEGWKQEGRCVGCEVEIKQTAHHGWVQKYLKMDPFCLLFPS